MTGEKLKQYLRERGIRLRWVANELNITPQAFYNKVNGTSKVTMEEGTKIKYICRMSETEFDKVFNEEPWRRLI